MAKKEQVPAIRFQGFADPWEQRKLGEMASLITKGTTPLDKSNTGEVNFVKIESIDEASGEITITQKITNEEHEGYLRRSQLKENDILFSIAGTLGRVTSVESSILPANTNQALAIIRLKNGDLQYVKTYLKGKAVSDYIKKNPTIGAQPNLSLEQVGSLEIALPSVQEQRIIGDYFRQLDNLITLHQRKYDKLVAIKRSMLEKMFPREGSRFPEIRFAGFTDPWEQRKLGELYTERNECGDDTLQILSVSIHSGVSDGELDTDGLGKMVRRSEDKSTYKHVYVGDLIFNMMRAWQGAIGTTKSEGMISPAYISAIPSDEVYPPFMSYLLRRKEAINQINNLSYGVTDFRKRLYWDSFVRVSCLLPSVEEQRYITEVLEKIDTLITLHQRKLEKLQAIKRSMLEKMFV